MRKVNLITKVQADAIAKNYFKNSKALSLYITRDGQIFLKGSENFMKMHINDCRLEDSWTYSRDIENTVIEEATESKEEVKTDFKNMGFEAAKKLASELTEKGLIEKEDWENLGFQPLKKFLKDK